MQKMTVELFLHAAQTSAFEIINFQILTTTKKVCLIQTTMYAEQEACSSVRLIPVTLLSLWWTN